MKKLIYILFSLFCILLISCASKIEFVQEKYLDQNKYGLVKVYRPLYFYQYLTLGSSYVYVDDIKYGKLGIGGELNIKLHPGMRKIAIHEQFLFFPSLVIRSMTINIKAGEKYHLLYDKRITAIVPIPYFGFTIHDANLSEVPATTENLD